MKLWLPVPAGTSALPTIFSFVCHAFLVLFLPGDTSVLCHSPQVRCAAPTSPMPPTKTWHPAHALEPLSKTFSNLHSPLPPSIAAGSVFTFTDAGRSWPLSPLPVLHPALPVFSRNLVPSWVGRHALPLQELLSLGTACASTSFRERTLLILGLLL